MEPATALALYLAEGHLKNLLRADCSNAGGAAPASASGRDDVEARVHGADQGDEAGEHAGVAGDRRLSAGTTFKYLGNLELGLKYIAYLGEPDPIKRPFADRDYATFSAKYSF